MTIEQSSHLHFIHLYKHSNTLFNPLYQYHFHMKKLITLWALASLVAMLAFPAAAFGQGCTPDPQYTTAGFFPETLPSVCINQPYDQVITVIVPADTTFPGIPGAIPIDSLVLTSLTDLPPGLSFECNAGGTACVFPGGQSGCIRIFGTPTQGGVYGIDINVTAYGQFFGSPLSLPLSFPDTVDLVVNEVTANTSVIDANCGASDGSATVTPTSTAAPFTYLWSTGGTDSTLSGIGAGAYTVTVTDSAGCAGIFNVNVQSVGIGATIDSASSLFGWTGCAEDGTGSIDPTVTGGTGTLTYAWSSGGAMAMLSGVGAGAYTLTVTDANQCVSIQEFVLTAPSAMSISTTGTDERIAGFDDGTAQVSASGGEEPYTISWSNGATNDSLVGLAPGTYTVTVTDALGCTKTDSVVVGARPVSNDITNVIQQVRVYPVPSDEVVTIAVALNEAADVRLQIIDLQGRQVWEEVSAQTRSIQHEVSLTVAGVYTLVLEANGKTYHKQLVIF